MIIRLVYHYLGNMKKYLILIALILEVLALFIAQRPAVSKEEKEIAATENDNQIDDEIKDCNLETNTEVETGTNNEAEETIEELDINMDQPLIAEEIPYNDQPYSINIKIPPMAAIVLKVNNISDGSKECRVNESFICSIRSWSIY